MTGYDLTEAIREASDHLHADSCPEDMCGCRCGHYDREAEIAIRAALPHLEKQIREDCLQRLGRALFAVDSKHHLNGTECLCGFVGDARKRTQTEHITAAVLEEYRHD